MQREKINLSEQINRIKQLIEQQDSWVIKAASGPQKCGLSQKNNSSGNVSGGMSRRQEKKSNLQYYNTLLKPSTNPDYEQRKSNIDTNSVPGNIDPEQKFAIVYNLTEKLNNNKSWFLNNYIRKDLKLQDDVNLSDKNILDYIKLKGGFDSFKTYYLNEIL